jgi:hypothetical protein
MFPLNLHQHYYDCHSPVVHSKLEPLKACFAVKKADINNHRSYCKIEATVRSLIGLIYHKIIEERSVYMLSSKIENAH